VPCIAGGGRQRGGAPHSIRRQGQSSPDLTSRPSRHRTVEGGQKLRFHRRLFARDIKDNRTASHSPVGGHPGPPVSCHLCRLQTADINVSLGTRCFALAEPQQDDTSRIVYGFYATRLACYPFVVRLRASSHPFLLTFSPSPGDDIGMPSPAGEILACDTHPSYGARIIHLSIGQHGLSSASAPDKTLGSGQRGPACCSLCRSSLSSAGLSSRRFLAPPCRRRWCPQQNQSGLRRSSTRMADAGPCYSGAVTTPCSPS
jgi:hypothetical protein